MKHFNDQLINILEKNKITYAIKQDESSNEFLIIIHSPIKERHLRIELYDGGYNFHFSIDNYCCFDEHNYSGDASFDVEQTLLNLIIRVINEELIGFRAEYANSVREFYCKPEEINKLMEKQMRSLEYLQEQGRLKIKDYKFSIHSFKGSHDMVLESFL